MAEITIEKISDAKKKEMKIPDTPKNVDGWAVWECVPSAFDWSYTDEEIAYVYEGKVKVHVGEKKYKIGPGDLVVFPKGLSCRWEVLEKIRKVYRFQ